MNPVTMPPLSRRATGRFQLSEYGDDVYKCNRREDMLLTKRLMLIERQRADTVVATRKSFQTTERLVEVLQASAYSAKQKVPSLAQYDQWRTLTRYNYGSYGTGFDTNGYEVEREEQNRSPRSGADVRRQSTSQNFHPRTSFNARCDNNTSSSMIRRRKLVVSMPSARYDVAQQDDDNDDDQDTSKMNSARRRKPVLQEQSRLSRPSFSASNKPSRTSWAAFRKSADQPLSVWKPSSKSSDVKISFVRHYWNTFHCKICSSTWVCIFGLSFLVFAIRGHSALYVKWFSQSLYRITNESIFLIVIWWCTGEYWRCCLLSDAQLVENMWRVWCQWVRHCV